MSRKTHKDIVKGWHPYTDEEVKTYVSRGVWHNLTVGDLLDRNVAAIPDKVAIIDDSRSVTWQELKQKSDRMALHFKKLGLEYGDFIVVISPNVVEFYCIFFGLARLGVIPVMCLPRHRRLEVSHMVALHEVKAIIVPSGERFDFTGMVEEIIKEAPFLKLFLTVGGSPVKGWLPVEQLLSQEIEKEYPADYLSQFKPEATDIVAEQLSGGTTGIPKGIPHTHNDYICTWEYGCLRAGQSDESVALCMTPVPHNMGFVAVAGPMFFRGGTTIITKFTRPEDHFKLIEKYRVTHVPMVPLLLTRWQEAEETLKKYDLSSVKVLEVGSQKVRPELVKWAIEKMHFGFSNVLGMTEGPHFGSRWDSSLEVHMNTVGKPYVVDECSQVKIVDGNNQEVKPGEVGELAIKSPMSFKGYFRNPEENAKSFDRDGFFHTGDLVYRRPDGNYVIEGRKKDSIKRGGENIYPDAVEAILLKNPRIANAALVGIPDLAMGERLCAFVQPAAGPKLTLQDIQDFLRDQGLAVYQWPERLEIVQGWPMVGNKIGKRFLRGYITTKLFEEGVVSKELGDDFLKKDTLKIDDILSGRVKIEFTGAP